ncbi:MAG TPA: L,D-transpeptidase family protein [Gaiellaceae bacterium]|nr:L,D-transpeptidase family protein [Gaiellaceae bacterium]
MRRLGLALLLAAGFSFSLAVSAVPGVADNGTTTTTPTETAPPPTTTTAPEPTTTAPAPEPVIPEGVSIQGVPVGGLTPSAAYLSLQSTFQEPLRLVVGKTRLAPTREQLGAVVYIWGAVTRAKSTAPGTDLDVRVAVKGRLLRAYVAQLAQRYDRKPVDARLRLRNLEPFVSKDRPGLRIEQGAARAAIVRALTTGAAGPVRIPVKELKPQVTRARFGPVVVIRRGDNRLRLYQGMKPWRTFTVATGQSIYPTPLGAFQIVVKWENPWWYPPPSPWAAGEKPVPPGPGNPLGTRWMGLSSPGVGIHGTPDASSLGYSASHGCIRMAIPQAEWLFDHVDVGTPVYIVAA